MINIYNFTFTKSLISLFLVLFVTITALHGKEELSQFENELLSETLQFQLSTKSCPSDSEAIIMIDEYIRNIATDEIQSKLSEEAKIIIDNILVLAKYTCMYNININDLEAKKIILEQYEKVVSWNDRHEDSLNRWYVVTSGDLINSTMRFLPQAQAIKLGLQEKKNYDTLVEKYPAMCIASMNSALWYYFAPAIGGGNRKKAGELFNNAYNNAVSAYEKYYSAIFLSQFYYVSDKNKCEEYLAAAEKAFPDTEYIKFIKMLNKNGYSVLDYSNNKEKIDKKLGL